MFNLYSLLYLLSPILLIFFFDLFILFLGDNNKKRRWYLIHAVTNTVIVFYTFNNLINCFRDPLSLIKDNDHKNNFEAINLVVSLHLFHIFSSYNNLTLIDWIHHLVSCLIVSSLALLFINIKMINYAIFFLCGLPGGIDYYLLYFNKLNLIDKLTEKRINVYLNMCIRLPGLLFGFFISYICIIYKELNDNISSFQIGILFLLNILNCINAIFFAIRVVQNYGIHLKIITKKKVLKHIRKSLSLSDLKKLDNKLK
jgi:hypothetical protein